MSLTVVSPSSSSELGHSGVDLSNPQDVIAQLHAAVQGNNSVMTQALAQTASELLDALNDAHENLSQSMASGNLSASSVSSMMEQLSQLDSDANDLEQALTQMGQLVGNNNAPATNNKSAGSAGAASGNGSGALPGSEPASSGANNAFKQLSSAAPDSQQMTGTQFLAMAANNPSILNSLKQYVKTEAQSAMMDALLNALGNASGTDSTSSGGSSSGGAKGAKAQAKCGCGGGGCGSCGGGGGSSGGSGGSAGGTTGSGGGVTNNFIFMGGNGGGGGGSNANNAGGAGAGASSGGDSGGMTFDTGSAAPMGGTVADAGGFIPTVGSGITLTQGGAQSGNGNQAALDGWDSNLGLSNPGNIDEFLMMVLLACYEDGQKGLEQMAQQLQKTNNAKKALRAQLSGLYAQTTGNPTTDAGVNAQIQNVQGQLSSASDDAQLQQLQLQNATQNQQQLLQEISSFSKNLYDASMNILRKIGS